MQLPRELASLPHALPGSNPPGGARGGYSLSDLQFPSALPSNLPSLPGLSSSALFGLHDSTLVSLLD